MLTPVIRSYPALGIDATQMYVSNHLFKSKSLLPPPTRIDKFHPLPPLVRAGVIRIVKNNLYNSQLPTRTANATTPMFEDAKPDGGANVEAPL